MKLLLKKLPWYSFSVEPVQTHYRPSSSNSSGSPACAGGRIFAPKVNCFAEQVHRSGSVRTAQSFSK